MQLSRYTSRLFRCRDLSASPESTPIPHSSPDHCTVHWGSKTLLLILDAYLLAIIHLLTSNDRLSPFQPLSHGSHLKRRSKSKQRSHLQSGEITKLILHWPLSATALFGIGRPISIVVGVCHAETVESEVTLIRASVCLNLTSICSVSLMFNLGLLSSFVYRECFACDTLLRLPSRLLWKRNETLEGARDAIIVTRSKLCRRWRIG